MNKKLMVAVGATVAFTFAGAVKIIAHSWYPPECCGGQDCAPVLHVQVAPGGEWLTTIHGTAFFPAGFQIRQSQDGQAHACMLPDGPGKMKPICRFAVSQM